MRISLAGCLIAALTVPAATAGQTPPAQQVPPAQQTRPVQPAGARLRVYLDCRGAGPGGCYEDYMRDEITFVDFVQQSQDAQVHVFATSQTTGGGGREMVLRLVGVNSFTGVTQELRALSLAGDTDATRRDTILQTLQVGLLGFLAREGLPSDVKVQVEAAAPSPTSVSRSVQDDPWNAWVFSVRGSGNIDAEESRRTDTWNLSVGADRVTREWAISFGSRYERRIQTFDVDDETVEVIRRDKSFNWFVAKSAGRHLSLGFKGRVNSSTFGNEKLAADAYPAVEYNIFPYDEYSERQLRLQYAVGIARAEYFEETIFGRLEETHPRHEFSIDFDQRQPWGTLRAGFDFTQYLHDPGKNRLSVDGMMTFRVARGLSLNVNGSASHIRDQLSLPLRGATPEEVLLRVRELASGYDVRVNFSVTYTFGSIFNNIVNPRFGGDRGRSGPGGGGPGGGGGGPGGGG